MSTYGEPGLQNPAGTEKAVPPEDIQPILMSVKEMGTLLGLGKTERYWLVHKNVFDSRQFAGKTWIVRDSFEKWYVNQVKYHKVNGESPGKELKEYSYSAEDIAFMLGVTVSTAYEIIKREGLETITVDNCRRVAKESFERWYAGQDKFRNREDRHKDAAILKTTVSMPEMARLLGVSRSCVYSILKSDRYRHFFEFMIVNGQKRITWKSLDAFLAGQEQYHLYFPADRKGKTPEENGRLANFRKKVSMNKEDTRPIGTRDYLTVDEAAVVAKVSKTTIYNWQEKGYFPVKRIGRTVRIPRKDFEGWMEKAAAERKGE